MTAPLLPAHGSAAPLASPTSVEHAQTPYPLERPSPLQGDGGYRVRCTYADDYSGNVLPREYQPHMSTDIMFNAWIEDDVATWPTADLATQAALGEYEPDDFEVEPAIGPARPAIDVVYVHLGGAS